MAVGCSPWGGEAVTSNGVRSVYSLRPRTVWQYSTGQDDIIATMGAPVATADVVLFRVTVPRLPDIVRALDAGTGRLLWERTGESFALAGDEAVVRAGDELSCLDTLTGTLRWSRRLGSGWDIPQAGMAIHAGRATIAVHRQVAALSVETGEELWVNRMVAPDADPDALVVPVPGDRVTAIVFYRAAGPVVGLCSADGTELWRYELPEPVMSAPWAEEGLLLARTAGRVVAVELATGTPRWDQPMPVPPQGGAAVAALDGKAYSVSGRRLVELSLADGHVLAESELPEPLAIVGPSVLVAVDGMLGIACLSLEGQHVQAVFYLYDPEDRRIAYASPMFSKAVVSRLASSPGRLIFVTLDEILCMELHR